MFTSIVAVENNRISKFQEFDTKELAEAHCQKYGGFVYPGEYSKDLYVEGHNVSVQAEQETPEQVIARLDACIERHIQDTVKSLGYNNVERLSVYINSTNPDWKAEALAAPKWITSLWEKALVIQTDVNNGTRDIPTEEELIAEMPLFKDYLTS
jgi:hypothetical protein